MISDPDLRRDLDFLRSQKAWVYREFPNQDKVELLNPPVIPAATGVYWVYGESRLKSGKCLESVFRIDTDAGGALVSVYWRMGKHWYSHDHADIAELLRLSNEDIFPFDWKLAVPLQEDFFHPE